MVDSTNPSLVTPRPSASKNAEKWVCLGLITAPHGIQGEVKLKSFTQDPRHIGAYGPLFLENHVDKLTLLKLRSPKHIARETIFVAQFKEIDDRETAELLTGQNLFILKDKLPKITESESFYFEDLIGLKIVSTAQREQELGHVSAVLDFGAGESLELDLEGYKETILIPFLKEWVVEINMEKGFLILDASYLAEYLKPFKPSDERWDEKTEEDQ